MAVGLFLLIIVAVVVLVGIGVVVSSNRQGITRAQRKELRESRLLIDRLRRTALQCQEIEPNLAALVLDEINSYQMKELS